MAVIVGIALISTEGLRLPGVRRREAMVGGSQSELP